MAYDDILAAYSDAMLLKEGGQKAAYRATDPTRGVVVVKVGRYPSPKALERIRREVAVLQGIDSPYYPKILGFDTRDPNIFVIIEEYVESRPLSACLGEYTHPPRAVALLRHLVVALDLLWCSRIVHRDVKPDNILMTPAGMPKVIDLGIARLLDAESLTETVNPRGPCTPVYAAPEQLKNRKAQIDQRTDQFSLGIVFLQLLLGGRHPFDPRVTGTGEAIVSNILAGTWARDAFAVLRLPAVYSTLANRLLGPEPFLRYRTTTALLEAVAACEGVKL